MIYTAIIISPTNIYVKMYSVLRPFLFAVAQGELEDECAL